MTLLSRVFLALGLALALPVAAGKITLVTVDGQRYSQITDVHVVSGGRVVILYGDSGITVTPDKLPQDFLDSWAITKDQLASSKTAAAKQAENVLNQAIAAGYFREVGGVVYDLRKPQSGWMQIAAAKIVQVTDDGALVNTTPGATKPTLIYIRNLPKLYTDNQTISVTAKSDGTFSFFVNGGMQHTIAAYDIGRPCQKSEIPAPMLEKGLAAMGLPSASPRRPRRIEGLPGENNLRAIGSGFFVTRDGYLLTNFHVVKDANRVEVKSKDRTLKAEVVDTDQKNDLALLKVSGTGFQALRLSDRPHADLGESVFTIGFPNIDLQGTAPKFTDGKISSLEGMMDDPSEYQISVPVQPGNSGGPLCDANGDVVGVVVARLNDMAMLRSEGVIPQNVNYAVKAPLADRMLQRVADLQKALPKEALRPGKVVESVEDAVAMIMIY